MKKLFTLPIKIKNGPLKGNKFNVDIPLDVSETDLAKITIDGAFLAGSSFLAVISSIAAITGGGAAVVTAGALTITATMISATIGVVGAVVALGVFVPALVNMIREANTTTLILLNVVPNSTMRITKVSLEKGKWEDTDEEAIKRDHADVDETEAAALIFRTQPYRSGGLVKGHFNVELKFDKTGHTEHFKIYWNNPLGPDRKRSKATYKTSLSTSSNDAKAIFAPSPHLSHSEKTGAGGKKHTKTRADIVTYVIGPTTSGLKYLNK